MDKVSYALGLSIGHNFRATGIKDVQVDDFLRGFRSAMEGEEPEISIAEAQEIMQAYMKKLSAEKYDLNKSAGEEFLKINAKRKGVQTLDCGVQYMVLQQGSGALPKATDTVKCHYEGKLINGTVFDSSYKRGEPAVFPLNGVIKGWTLALQHMPVGSKWRLFIPSDLAYGETGAGDVIEPNQVLIFDIELLGLV